MDLSALFKSLFTTAQAASEPQAMTRITRTPVRWSSDLAGDTFGQYQNGGITMNQDLLPQHNADPESMSNILRHESVHALMPPEARKGIEAYFNANPGDAKVGRENLAQLDPRAAASNSGLAGEAPAYAVQGYRFGLPSERIITEYLKHMPDSIRQKYLQLLRPGGGR